MGINLYALADDVPKNLVASGGIPIPTSVVYASDLWTTSTYTDPYGLLNLPAFQVARGAISYRKPPARLNAAVDPYPVKSIDEIRAEVRREVDRIADELERAAHTCASCGRVSDYPYDDWDED